MELLKDFRVGVVEMQICVLLFVQGPEIALYSGASQIFWKTGVEGMAVHLSVAPHPHGVLRLKYLRILERGRGSTKGRLEDPKMKFIS